MLFTRCPDCDTTFRVTDEALKKANGQVRCGRCASVFNAYSELRDPHTGAEVTLARPEAPRPAAPQPNPAPSPAPAPSTPASAPAFAGAAAADAKASHAAAAAAPVPPVETKRSIPSDDILESISMADVVKQVQTAAADAAAERNTDETEIGADTISAEQVERVLETNEDTLAGAPWPLDAPVKRPSRWWSVAALLALVALGAQIAHHFRAALVRNAIAGPYVQQAYELVGMNVVPSWDVRQYAILDWVATAEPNTRGQGSLKITARIQNRGPHAQPYPSVQLRLKDRWEAAVGSRIFAPAEYLAAAQTRSLMAPGETVRAELEVVDPGPDAYGFELDVCIEVERDGISCGNDKVFL